MAAETFASNGQTNHTTSYYAASANPSPDRPALKGDKQIDVCCLRSSENRFCQESKRREVSCDR